MSVTANATQGASGARTDVSIVMAAYNAENTIADAIQSVVNQQGAPPQLVIVDDGSTDATLGIANRFASLYEWIQVLSKMNGGTASAVNAGMHVATGTFVARLDADDELGPYYMETLRQFVRMQPGFDIYAPDLWLVRADGLRSRVFGWNTVRSLRVEDLLNGGFIPGAATLVRKSVVENVGGYREGIRNEDHDFWLRALARGARHVYVPEPLYLYKQRDTGQKTSNAGAMYESNAQILEDLLSEGALDEWQSQMAERTIADYRHRIAEIRELGGRSVDQIMAESAAARLDFLRRALTRVFSERGAQQIIRVIYGLRWIARPFRKAIWRMRHWLRGSGR